MPNIDDIVCGAIESTNPTDFTIEVLPSRGKWKRKWIDQRAIDPYSCFYSASWAACMDAYDLSPEELSKAKDKAGYGFAKLKADGKFTPGVGGKMADGVDYARREWNLLFPDKPVASYRMTTLDLMFSLAIIRGWAPLIGWYPSKEKVEDMADDGIVQGDTRDAKSYGHLVRIEHGLQVVDNYPRGPVQDSYKRYVLDDFETKVKNGLVFTSSYIVLPKNGVR